MESIKIEVFFDPLEEWLYKPRTFYCEGVMWELEFLFFRINIYLSSK